MYSKTEEIKLNLLVPSERVRCEMFVFSEQVYNFIAVLCRGIVQTIADFEEGESLFVVI